MLNYRFNSSHIDVSQFDGDETEEDSVLEDSDKLSEDTLRRLDTVPRRCTDCSWLLIFFVANCFLGYVALIGVDVDGGDSRHSTSDRIWDGVCDGGRPFTRGKPYMFLCGHNSSGLLTKPLCVEECPNSSSTRHLCTSNSTGDQEWLADYPTATFQNALCAPREDPLQAEWIRWVERHYPPLYTRMAWDAQVPLVLAMGLSILVSCSFIFCLHNCAGYVVWSTFLLLVAVPFGFTAISMYCWLEGPCASFAPEEHNYCGTTVVMGTVGATTACILWYEASSISKAVEVLQEASRCMFEARSLLLEPLLHMVFRVASASGLIFIWVRLLHNGQRYREGKSEFVAYHPVQMFYMGFLALMFCWHAQFISSVSSFAIMYVTWMWYFDTDDGGQDTPGFLPWRGLFRAYWLAIRYHMGTLAFGAFLLAVTLPIRTVLGPLVSFSHVEGNIVGFILREVCCCFIDLYDHHFVAIDDVALMEAVINGKNWCSASRSALKMVMLQESTVTFFSGVTRVFRVAAIAVVMYLGAVVALCEVTKSPKFSDPASPTYILRPAFVSMVAACISGVVAMPFHWAYDTVGNAVLYCWTIDFHTQEVHDQARAQRSCIGKLMACTPIVRPGR